MVTERTAELYPRSFTPVYRNFFPKKIFFESNAFLLCLIFPRYTEFIVNGKIKQQIE